LNCPRTETGAGARCRLALLALLALLSGCAATPRQQPAFERWPSDGVGTAAPYLLALREYLAQPPTVQDAQRDNLRAAAETGDQAALLEYALVLSVNLDDRRMLERSRALLEELLASAEPLPVAIDAIARLQLRQVIDRIERMQVSGDVHDAYRAAADDQRVCRTQLEEERARSEALRADLREVREKLDALARIEQTVNGEARPQPINRQQENDDDGQGPRDTAGR